MKLLLGTNYVTDNEPCLGLAEINRSLKDGLHRFRIITVIRNDEKVTFEQDLGLSSNFKVEQYNIPGGVSEGKGGVIYHNVGELVNIADQLSGIKLWDKQELAKNNNIRLVF